jgi:esterase/lipase
MDSLAEVLRAHGYHTLRISLAGHELPTTETFSSATWIRQIASSLRDTQQQYPTLPVYYLGYSMSGLAAVRALDTDSSFSPKRMILIAPALSLRTIVESASILRWFPPTTLSVSNLAPHAYRRYARTPLFWYRNVAEMYQETNTLQHPGHVAATPTLVFANPRDELVSLAGLKSWIADNHLSETWKLSIIRPNTPDPRLAEHLLIDQRALGAESWHSMITQILDFIERQPLSEQP